MKTIVLTTNGQYSDLEFLKTSMAVAPVWRGLTTSEARMSLRVLDVLDDTNGTELVLEDADFSHLLKRMSELKWQVVDRDALACIYRIERAANATLDRLRIAVELGIDRRKADGISNVIWLS